MLAKNDTISTAVENWLAELEQALAAPGDAALRVLFASDCHWRDVLAPTWTVQTLGGRDAVVSTLKAFAARVRAKGFRIRAVARRGRRCAEGLDAAHPLDQIKGHS